MSQPPVLPPSSLRYPLVAGALARMCAACVAISFHARDDYFHVLAPALAWLHDPNFDWDQSDAPGAQIRSHLLPRLVWLLLRGLRAVGINSPEGQLRGLYLVMGAYSLLLIPAMASAARRFFDEATARRAAWLAALFFPFPYVGTRLLIEAVAMPPLVAAVGLCAAPKRREAMLGGLLLGIACWWRFQCVAAVAGVGLWMAWRNRRGLLPMIGGFAAAICAQGAFDWATTGVFLGPVFNNIMVNLDPPDTLSRSAPWGYLGLWLALTIPPATFWLLPAMVRASRVAMPAVAAWLMFVAVHSAIPHKEDRFMIPAIGLFALLLAAAPSFVRLGGWTYARGYAVGLAALALILAITSQSQANLRDTMLLLRDDPTVRGVISVGPELQTYFLDRAEVAAARTKLDEAQLHQALVELAVLGKSANRFVAFASDRHYIEVWLRLEGYTCSKPTEVAGWWGDRLLQRLNPKKNRRRGPVLLYACENPAMAKRHWVPEKPDALARSLDQNAPPHQSMRSAHQSSRCPLPPPALPSRCTALPAA